MVLFGCVEVRDETEQEDYVGKRNVAEERTRNDINSSKEEVIVEDVVEDDDDDDDDDNDGDGDDEVEEDDEEEEEEEDEDEDGMENELRKLSMIHKPMVVHVLTKRRMKRERKLSMMPRIHKPMIVHVLKYQNLKLRVMLIPVAAKWQLVNKKETPGFIVYVNRRPTSMSEVINNLEAQFTIVCNAANNVSVLLEAKKARIKIVEPSSSISVSFFVLFFIKVFNEFFKY